MNTIKSVYYGWGTLIVAGGGAYYFAKRSINADRAQKAEADHKKRIAQYNLEHSNLTAPQPTDPNPPAPRSVTSELGKKKAGLGKQEGDWHTHEGDGNPSQEASTDPAPTRHAPEDETQKMKEKSKYEASDIYRSRKGDRFS